MCAPAEGARWLSLSLFPTHAATAAEEEEEEEEGKGHPPPECTGTHSHVAPR